MRVIEWLKPQDEPSRRLFPGFVGFFVALGGAAIAGIAHLLGWWWLYLVGFTVAAAGIIGGGLFILWGFVTFPREFRKSIEEFRKRSQKSWKRPDWRP